MYKNICTCTCVQALERCIEDHSIINRLMDKISRNKDRLKVESMNVVSGMT
jgi:hypothetical protein